MLLIEGEDGVVQRMLLGNAEEDARRVIELAGYDMDIYITAKKLGQVLNFV